MTSYHFWGPFHRMVTCHKTAACVQEFLRVSPHPPEYPICKGYLDFLVEIINELDIPHMFVHSDEMVYSKLCDILWKSPPVYKNLILLKGGFHQLRVEKFCINGIAVKAFKSGMWMRVQLLPGLLIKALKGGITLAV